MTKIVRPKNPRRVKFPRVRSNPFNGVKEFTSLIPSTMYSHKWTTFPPGTDQKQRSDGGWQTFQSTFIGSQNPRWRDQVRAGVNATTNCSGTKREYSPAYYHAAIQVIPFGAFPTPFGQEDVGYPSLPGLFGSDLSAPNAAMITSVTNRAIVKFLDNCESARSSFEAGQDLGEYRETIKGLMHPLKSLREFTLSHLSRVLKNVSKGKIKHKASVSKMVADTWLEYRFGWRPLALDIAQGYADLMRNQHFDTVPVRASAHDTFPIINTQKGVLFQISGSYTARVTYRVTGEYFVTFKGQVRTGAKAGQIGLQQNLQLDLPHFLPTIWDLLPYSWIADYFANVGDIIRSLSVGSANVAWLNKTVRTVVNYDYSYDPVDYSTVGTPPNGNNTLLLIEQPSGAPLASCTSFTRSAVLPSSLVPEFQFSVPLSDKPWLNMAALMLGRQKEISKVASTIR